MASPELLKTPTYMHRRLLTEMLMECLYKNIRINRVLVVVDRVSTEVSMYDGKLIEGRLRVLIEGIDKVNQSRV